MYFQSGDEFVIICDKLLCYRHALLLLDATKCDNLCATKIGARCYLFIKFDLQVFKIR